MDQPLTERMTRPFRAARLGGWLALLAVLAAGLCACVSAPTTPPSAALALLDDRLYASTRQQPDTEAVFAMSPAMMDYTYRHLSDRQRQNDPRRALLEALYDKAALKLSYDATRTRNAAEAFEAREGNCLSLVIMTAAFARHLQLPVSFQFVLADEFYSRSGNLLLASQHVNLVLGPPRPGTRTVMARPDDNMIVDFMPPEELRGRRSRTIDERTIVAMYFNNRAAELLAQGQAAQAYWWAREALLHDPGYANAANTLAVIYLRTGHEAAAEAALRHALASSAERVSALSNLVPLLQRQQRLAEAQELAQELARLQPVPPFQRLQEGVQAMAEGHYEEARSLFRQELQLQPYQDEVHFWAAQAAWRLGRHSEAAHHLTQARDYSPSRAGQQRYSAKLEQLRAGPRIQ